MSDVRRRATWIFAIAAAAAACVAVVPAASAAPGLPAGSVQRLAAGGRWERAQVVPGLAALNKGDDARISSVSCASAGNCSAGGAYQDGSNVSQAFVVSEVNGRWRKAEEVPGTAALNTHGAAGVTSVSCASAGNCSAGGNYAGGAFVVSEVHGAWRKAEKMPGIALAQINSVSCGSAGNCSAGGFYPGVPGGVGEPTVQAFVVSEVRGRWRNAEEVPGTAALNKYGYAALTSVSCGSAGNCSAGGTYTSVLGVYATPNDEAFVVSEVHGRWRKAEVVPGTAAFHPGEYEISSVSCVSAGNCSAGGNYQDAYGGPEAFVVSEVHGRWRKAEKVPGIGLAQINSVSCGSAGNCSAGGSDGPDGEAAILVSQVHGTWRNAEVVPGTAALNKGDSADIYSVSCASAGNCSAGGYYTTGRAANGAFISQPFVVSEVNGRWRRAEEVPGTAALNRAGQADIYSVSCASAGHCSAGGYYTSGRARNGADISQAFVVSSK